MKVALIGIVVCLSLSACVSGPSQAEEQQAARLAAQSARAMLTKDFAAAQQADREAVRLNPTFAEAWVGLGMASMKLGQVSVAQDAYEHALAEHRARQQRNPEDASQVLQEVTVLVLLGRHAEAGARLRDARRLFPNDQTVTLFSQDFLNLMKGFKAFTIPPEAR